MLLSKIYYSYLLVESRVVCPKARAVSKGAATRAKPYQLSRVSIL